MRAAEATAPAVELLLDLAPCPATPSFDAPAPGDPSPLFKSVPAAIQRRRDDNWLARHVGRVRPDPFGILYERHWRGLSAFCISIAGSRDEAEDAAQEAMARAYAVLSSRREQPDFKPWIYAIARNAALDRLRQRNRGPELGLADDDVLARDEEDPGEVLGRRDEVRTLFADLGLLSERQRAAIVLRELSGLSHEEIAVTLETTPDRSKALVAEARQSLSRRLAGRGATCSEYRRAFVANGGRIPRGQRLSAHRDACPDCSSAARPRLLAGITVVPFFDIFRSAGRRTVDVLAGTSGTAAAGGAAKLAAGITAVAALAVGAGAVFPAGDPEAPGDPGPARAAARAALPVDTRHPGKDALGAPAGSPEVESRPGADDAIEAGPLATAQELVGQITPIGAGDPAGAPFAGGTALARDLADGALAGLAAIGRRLGVVAGGVATPPARGVTDVVGAAGDPLVRGDRRRAAPTTARGRTREDTRRNTPVRGDSGRRARGPKASGGDGAAPGADELQGVDDIVHDVVDNGVGAIR